MMEGKIANTRGRGPRGRGFGGERHAAGKAEGEASIEVSPTA